MKWTPQKTMYSASGVLRRPLRELEGVAAVVGELDDVLALVVVAEDDRAAAERRARRADARDSSSAPSDQYSSGIVCCHEPNETSSDRGSVSMPVSVSHCS